MHEIVLMANIIAITVVLFVAAAFIVISSLYFRSYRRLLEAGLEDDSIRNDIRAELSRLGGRATTAADAEKRMQRSKRNCDTARRIIWGVLGAFCLFALCFTALANLFVGERHIWIDDTAMLVIQTDSMASVNEQNKYLEGTDDRIRQYEFITVSRRAEHISSLAVGDIAAFCMKDKDGNEMTVVHRLIEIEYGDDGQPLYTFRGDANASSMAGEYRLPADSITGVFSTKAYHGAQSLPLGYFITYLRSLTGIIMIAVSIIMMAVFFTLSDKTDKLYDARYDMLRGDELHSAFSGTNGGNTP